MPRTDRKRRPKWHENPDYLMFAIVIVIAVLVGWLLINNLVIPWLAYEG